MSFDLRIHVSGLCCWTTDGTSAVHVIMPTTEGAGDMQHFARLLYDSGYEESNPATRHFTHYRRCIPVDHQQLVFSDAWSATFDPTLCAELVDANAAPFSRSPLDPKHLAASLPSTEVSTRVQFAAGAFTSRVIGHTMKVGDHRDIRHIPVATSVEWTIRGIDRDHLSAADFHCSGFDTLYPIGGVIELFCFHAPAAELSLIDISDFPGPIISAPLEHFTLYYSLFEPQTDEPIPEMANNPPVEGDDCQLPAPQRSGEFRTYLEEGTKIIERRDQRSLALPLAPYIVRYPWNVASGVSCGGMRTTLGS